MINKMHRKFLTKKRYLAIFLVISLCIQICLPLFTQTNVFAETPSNLTLKQEILSKTIGMDDEVKVKLYYSTSGDYDFYNTVISYTLPEGAQCTKLVMPNTVTNANDLRNNYQNLKKLTFNMKSLDKNNNYEGYLRSGQSGDITITFKIKGPKSPYPDGRIIKLDKSAKISANLKKTDGELIEFYADGGSLTYQLPSSWYIEKSSSISNVIISKDTNITYVDVDYKIELKGGNIDLRDVEIIDILPQDVVVINSDGGDTTTNGKIKWEYSNVNYGETKIQNITLRFPIKGRGSNVTGVEDKDKRINKVKVSGYPTDLDSNGNVIKAKNKYTFSSSTDQVSTNFTLSNRIWGVYASDDKTIKIPLNPSITTIQESYYLGFVNGDRTIKDVILQYEIPEIASVINFDGGTEVSEKGKKYIRWSVGSVDSNTSYRKNIILSYPIIRNDGDIGVKKGDEKYNYVTATAKFDSGEDVVFNPTLAQVKTSFIEDDIKWKLSKSSSPKKVIIPDDYSIETETVTYTIKVKSTGKNPQNNLTLKKLKISDNLPDGAKFISSNPAIDSSSTIDDPTWTFNDVGPSTTPTVQLKVSYPIKRYAHESNDSAVMPDTSVENKAFVEATIDDGSDTPYNFTSNNDKAVTSFKQVQNPSPSINIKILDYNNDTNNGGYKHFNIGDKISYEVEFNNNNHNGHELKNVSLEGDNFPEHINLIDIKTGVSKYNLQYKLLYKTSKDGGWQEYSKTLNTGEKTTINKTDLDSHNKIYGLKFTYIDDVPVNFSYSDKMTINGQINSSAVNGENISYGFKAEGKYLGFKSNEDFIKNSSISFEIRINTAWISKFNKTIFKDSDSGVQEDYGKAELINFQIDITNKDRWATGELINPVIIDILPYGVEFLSFDNKWGDDVTLKTIDNYPIDGKTTLIWTFNKNLPIGQTFSIKYKTKVANYAIAGTYTNKIFLMSLGAYHWKYNKKSDLDFDNDGKMDTYIKGDGKDIKIRKSAALDATKWVRGELDYRDYIKNLEDSNIPDDPYEGFKYRDKDGDLIKGRSTPGGSADYSLRVKNVGSVKVTKIELIDILPRIGDSSVLNSSKQRDSMWTPYLIEELKKGNLPVITDTFGNKKNADVKVFYSKAFDPIRQTNDGTIGTQQPEWTEIPPKNLTQVKSLKFVINFIPDDYLKPDSEVRIDWRMRAPINAPTNSDIVAWNSVGLYGEYKFDNKIDALPWNEPYRVGIKILENPYGCIGDFIWYDKNGDGIQNDGYDNEYAGINGITVSLYKKRLNEHVWKKVDTTLTGNNHEGKPGYYLFPSLDTAEYYVAYEIPDYYKVTRADNGDDIKDSDGKLGTIEEGAATRQGIRSGVIYIDGTIPDKIYDVDLGVIKSDTILGEASLDITKKATHYQKVKETNKIPLGDPKISLNRGETIIYNVTVLNDSKLPINNITIKDYRETAYFVLTNEQMTDNIIYNKSTDSNTLKIKQLLPNETYNFECRYVVSDSDLNNQPLINTVGIWANELVDQENSDEPYKRATDTVDIADLSLDKKVVKVEKKDGTIIPIKDMSSMGVEKGDILTYRITVTNVGSIALDDIIVEDKKIILETTKGWEKIDDNKQKISLGVGESAFIEGKYIVKDSDVDVISNIATAKNDKIRTTREVDIDVYSKGMVLTKTVKTINGKLPVKIDGKYVAKVGDVIEYEVTFTNTDDNTTLKNVMITKDELISSKNNQVPRDILNPKPSKISLSPGQSRNYTYTYRVQESDISKTGATVPITNTVYGKSSYTKLRQSSQEVGLANLELTKEVDKKVFRIGEDITYTIKVKNNGTIPLHNVKVTDLMLGFDGNIKGNIGELAVDAEKTLTGVYRAVDEDSREGKIENTATAVSDETPIKKVKVTINKYIPPIEPKQEPDISIYKKGDKTNAKVGDDITYTITVTNTGKKILTNVVIKDTMLSIDKHISSLAIGESKTVAGTYTVTKEDSALGKVENIASVASYETDTKKDKWVVSITKDEETNKEIESNTKDKDKEKDKDKKKEENKKKEDAKEDKEEDTKKEESKIIPKHNVKPIEIIEKPEHGKIDIDNEGNIVYKPNEGYKGKDTFKIKVITEDGEEEIMEIEIEDGQIPKGIFDKFVLPKTLPKTGQKYPSPYYPIGYSLIALGLYLNIKRKK
ncbi:DUF7507 domain-containing protein [Vallitalea sp.]|jgi:hypothetical protein|uniref:DUF7507 domain-containing protein n=1 Tax=Vallitalea sp. TaxID=1882829 RepID=UPI0025D443AC|nr:SdrD B-like domain-containing protein [Vallitalea sp.]MCT4687999.1 Ig-like domain-containing protein [Vallitalea sp.]